MDFVVIDSQNMVLCKSKQTILDKAKVYRLQLLTLEMTKDHLCFSFHIQKTNKSLTVHF